MPRPPLAPPPPPGRRRIPGAVVLLLIAAACAPPIGVKPMHPREVHRQLTANALSSHEPSEYALRVLGRYGLREVWEDDPARALSVLHAGIRPEADQRDRIFALAELSFAYAGDVRDPARYRAAMVYAYALLFPETGDGPIFDPADPRLRWSYDLYNRALTEGFAQPTATEVAIQPGRYPLPFGDLDVSLDPAQLAWGPFRLTKFVAAADLHVDGLRNRYRDAGIGAPLNASIERSEKAREGTGFARIPASFTIPVTAFLRIETPRASLVSGHVVGSVELIPATEARTVDVDGRAVPLEVESTSSLANTLSSSRLWDVELSGFLQGGLSLFDPKAGSRIRDGLFMLQPYKPGRIPVVFVNGTASSAARWADMVNEIQNDRRIGDRYSIWLFMYNTGNPIAFSAAKLRRALATTVRELDPAGADPALERMVVIGHSQGGLLTKLTAVESGDVFWRTVSDRPLEELEFRDPTERETLREAFFMTRLPFVERVVFVATPHRGSFWSPTILGKLASSLITLPVELVELTTDVITRNQGKLLIRRSERGGLATSIDEMNAANPYLQRLSSLPLAPGVSAHSIIAVRGDGPVEEGDDGVVEYTSAHIDGVASELVVRSGHSVQSNPGAIEEVRRILRLHAGAE